ncbi:MAG: DUF4430 domain-containing protein [Defluviitaleaceae bacterium]|nr:DUF4430 domain-containing protein [Defluviitaleaceae bacterium]
MKKIFLLTALIAIFALAGCDVNAPPDVTDFPSTDLIEVGTGETIFTLVVDHGEISTFRVSTDEETVGDALFALNLIDGEYGAFGLFVTTVNGITADFDEDGAWWAFWVDGEMSMTGVSETPAENGANYAFVLTR